MSEALTTLDQLEGNTTPALQNSGSVVPYLFFFSENSKKAEQIRGQVPDATDGTPILFDGIRYRDATEYPLLVTNAVFQFWGKYDAKGDLTEAVLTPDRGKTETIESVVFVLVDGAPIPAKVRWKGPKAPFVKQVQAEQAESGGTAWAARSTLHANAAKLPKPYTRVTATIALTEKDGRNGVYHLADAVCAPTDAPTALALDAAGKDEQFRKDVAAVLEAFNKEVAAIKQRVR